MAEPAHFTQRGVPYFKLQAAKAFAGLTPKERLYAHYLNTACWHGSYTCAAQVSAESPGIIRLFYTLFANNSEAELRAAAGGVDAEDFDKFLEYAAYLYSNMGNYKSFGDSKFIPAVDEATFTKIVAAAPNKAEEIKQQLAAVAGAIFSAQEEELALGWQPKGRTSYYSPDMTQAEGDLVDRYLTAQRIEQWNTRIWKVGEKHYEVRIPCAKVRKDERVTEEGVKIDLAYGDFAKHFAKIVENISKAAEYAANEEQRAMLAAYARHFETGEIEDHKEAQRHWVKDKGPAVETNVGFIETYRDPQGVRAEWEGFVAIVDKEQSKRYGELAERGEEFIPQLPWGADFENKEFKHPDFTSLEVLGFASSGVPLGICIPNYNDIRKDFGFKNVMLGNSGSAMNFNDKMNHVTDADWELYKKHFFDAMSINVGVHELLGHGTGKLLSEKEDGSFNFEKGTLVSPLTGKVIDSWYKPGETWGSVFQDTANPYEECRAESVSLYLALNKEVMAIFGKTGEQDIAETVHVMWLNMVRGGLIGLEFYTPEAKKWRQAHSRARYAILQTLLRCKDPLVKIEQDQEAKKLEITIDAARIATDGKAAMGELLCHLNINKATADVKAGKAFFDDLTAVDDKFLAIRETVLALRKPRKEFVQAHTRLNADGTDAELIEFDASPSGVIASLVTRHSDIPF